MDVWSVSFQATETDDEEGIPELVVLLRDEAKLGVVARVCQAPPWSKKAKGKVSRDKTAVEKAMAACKEAVAELKWTGRQPFTRGALNFLLFHPSCDIVTLS